MNLLQHSSHTTSIDSLTLLDKLLDRQKCRFIGHAGRYYKRANKRSQRIEANKLFPASKKLNYNGFGK